MFKYILFEILAGIVGIVAFVLLIIYLWKNKIIHRIVQNKHFYIPAILIFIAIVAGLVSNRTYAPNFAMPMFVHSHAPGKLPPSIPFVKIFDFLRYEKRFDHVKDIGANPNDFPKEPKKPDADGIVRISLTAKEVIGEIADDIYFNYWTYNEQVPGPMLRVREGDTVEVSLTNDPSSLHHHNIDLHAVTGPGGGASVTHVAPGETKTFKWKALNPGLYVYHCAMPNVSTHNSHGQYGLILVEPKNGLSQVDKEFYIMQGELYTMGSLGKRGIIPFDPQSLLDGVPNYVTFNGRIETVPRMQANVGETVRMYVGNGGVNLISSFHVIGEIFDTVYPNASMGGALEKNTQTALVLPGGASIVEFKLDVPGRYLLVDHALARMNKGAWAVLEVKGKENPDIFSSIETQDLKPKPTEHSGY